jgi:hypothetical protein
MSIDLEFEACTPRPVRLDGFNPNAALPFGLTTKHTHLSRRCCLLGTSVSAYERGLRKPSSLVVLEYVRLADGCVDTLISDVTDLPSPSPNKPKHNRNAVRNS